MKQSQRAPHTFSEMQSLRFAGCFSAAVLLAVCAAPGAESAALQPQPTALETDWLDLPVVEDIYGDADDKGARKMRYPDCVFFCCFIFSYSKQSLRLEVMPTASYFLEASLDP